MAHDRADHNQRNNHTSMLLSPHQSPGACYLSVNMNNFFLEAIVREHLSLRTWMTTIHPEFLPSKHHPALQNTQALPTATAKKNADMSRHPSDAVPERKYRFTTIGVLILRYRPLQHVCTPPPELILSPPLPIHTPLPSLGPQPRQPTNF